MKAKGSAPPAGTCLGMATDGQMLVVSRNWLLFLPWQRSSSRSRRSRSSKLLRQVGRGVIGIGSRSRSQPSPLLTTTSCLLPPAMPPSSPEIVHEQSPDNSEPRPQTLLAAGFYTPLGPAFRRNHAAFPLPSFVDIWQLSISSALANDDSNEQLEKELWSGDLAELKERWAGKERKTRVALQCAGNRRDELSSVRPTEGLPWGVGTIANHLFSGVSVRDVLLELGVPDGVLRGEKGRWHVHFESGVGPKEEAGKADAWYGCSLPFSSVMYVLRFRSLCCTPSFLATVFVLSRLTFPRPGPSRPLLTSWRTRRKASRFLSNTAHRFGMSLQASSALAA